MNDYFLQIMKRTKVQRGYLAQNPYKRAKFYDQGFENVRNPPRTPHLQTYGKKYDLMKLLQVVTALMQLRKNEVNNSPVVQFKEGMKRNMERIKPAIVAAEQHFLGKPALDAIYKKTMDEIREMMAQRMLNSQGQGQGPSDLKADPHYLTTKGLINDLLRHYNKTEQKMLATQVAKDLSEMKGELVNIYESTYGDDNGEIRSLLEKEFANIFNARNFLDGNKTEDVRPMENFQRFMRNKRIMNPPNISAAEAMLEKARRSVALDRREEVSQIYELPQIYNQSLKKALIGESEELGDILTVQSFLGQHPEFESSWNDAQKKLGEAQRTVDEFALGSSTAQEIIKRAQRRIKDLTKEFQIFRVGKNNTTNLVTTPIQHVNNPLTPIVLASLPETALPPPPMPLPP